MAGRRLDAKLHVFNVLEQLPMGLFQTADNLSSDAIVHDIRHEMQRFAGTGRLHHPPFVNKYFAIHTTTESNLSGAKERIHPSIGLKHPSTLAGMDAHARVPEEISMTLDAV